MDHVLFVGEGDRLAGLHDDADGSGQVPLVFLLARQIEDLLELPSLDELHGEVDPTLGVEAELVDRDDSGVVELCGYLRLLEKARQVL